MTHFAVSSSRGRRRPPIIVYFSPTDNLTIMDSLPNELLIPILKEPSILLQDRIQLRAVSTRWQVVIEEELKKETTLVIRHVRSTVAKDPKGPKDLMIYDKKYINADLIALLHRLFPSVTQLTVNFSSNDFFRPLPELLSKYKTTMVTFTLEGSYDFEDDQLYIDDGLYPYAPTETSRRIAEAINALTSLTSLELFAIDISARLLPFLVPTLARLEQFAFRSCDMGPGDAPEKYEALVRLMVASLGTRCTSLNIQSVYWPYGKDDEESCVSYINIAPPANLTCQREGHGTRTFPNHLGTALFQSLSHLEQLTELRLTLLYHMAHNMQFPTQSDTPLARIKHLYLTEMAILRIRFDGRIFCQQLAAWFPGLESLHIHCYEEYVSAIRAHLNQFPESVNIRIEGFEN